VKIWNARILLLLSMLTIALSAEPMAAIADAPDDWSLTLKQPSSGYYGPQDELRMGIPAGIPAEELQQLKLEVDGIDVTSFIESDGSDAVYKPVQPLAWGKHEARVVEYTPDGEILERGDWTFEVRKTKLFREASLGAVFSLTGHERIAQRDNTNQPNPFSGNGSLTLNGSVANDFWKGNANGQFVYDDPNGNTRNGKKSIDVGDFLFAAQGGPLTVQAGHHSVAADNVLLQNGINNRGVSATIGTNVLHSSVTGFTMRSSPVTGFQHGFAISNPDDRIEGVTLQSYPLAGENGTVKLTGVYVNGNSTESGDFTGGDPTVMGGDGFGGTVDSVFFSNRLRIRGEYARTRFDFDGKTGSLASLTDHAYTALGTFKILDGVSLLDKPMVWTLGTQYRYFGTDYRSVADVTGGISDTEVAQIFTSANWANISVNGELDQGFDNVSDAPSLPKNRTRLGTLTIGWNPQPDYDQQGMPVVGFFGTPSLTGTVTSQQVLTVTSGAIAATGLDTLTNTLGADATFMYSTWNWHAGYMVTWLGNHTDAIASTRTDNANADITYALFNQRLTLMPKLELIREKNRGTLVDSKTVHPSLTTIVALLDNKVNAGITADVTRTFTNDGLQDGTTWSVNGNLDWAALKATTYKPGLTLSLTGNYTDTHDKVNILTSLSNYQLFLNATIDWNGGI